MFKLQSSLILAGYSVFSLSTAMAAQVVVIDAKGSIASSMTPGMVIDDASINVPDHDELTVMGADGDAVQVVGPHHGAIGGTTATSTATNAVAALGSMMSHTERNATFGATRGGVHFATPDSGKKDPWAIDATLSATECVFDGHKPMLWKPPAETKVRYTLKNEASGKQTTIDWPENASSIPWPADAALADGAKFTLSDGTSPRTITVKLVGPAASTGSAALLAANAGCSVQSKDLIQAVKPARVVAP